MQENLEHLIQVAHMVARQFGQDCEVVLYDLTEENPDHAVAFVGNGKITGKRVGDPCTDWESQLFRESPELLQDKLAYLHKTDDGRLLKSSSSYLRDRWGKIRYILSINFDVTRLTAMEYALHSFIGTVEKVEPRCNVNGLLEELLEQSVALVGIPVAMMTKEDKIRAVTFLQKSGAFLIMKSGDKIANYFGISKFTLYSYIDAGQK